KQKSAKRKRGSAQVLRERMLMIRLFARFRLWCLGIAALIVAPLALAQPAAAQSYPSHLVKIVVPFTAGSVTDIMARIIAAELSVKWGQNVIVENRPGISGTMAVAQAKPDGYTLMLTSNGHTVLGLVNKDLPFDPVGDFVGITRVCTAPYVLIVNPE